jgi:hypothetical protein
MAEDAQAPPGKDTGGALRFARAGAPPGRHPHAAVIR